jgi:hypothetical protein
VLLALQTLRIAIHRRKDATHKFLFIVVLFSGGCFADAGFLDFLRPLL